MLTLMDYSFPSTVFHQEHGVEDIAVEEKNIVR